MSMVDTSEVSSIYSTILSLNQNSEESPDDSQDHYKEFIFPSRNAKLTYQMANPYADSLWYNSRGEFGENAISDIQGRVEGSKKKRELDKLVAPSRIDSLQHKKVDSPIKDENFFNDLRFNESYFHSPRTGLKNVSMNLPETVYKKAFKELVETELKFAHDLKLIDSVYRSLLHNTKKYKNILSKSQETMIFSNVGTLMELSELFIRDISKAVKRISTVDLDLKLRDQLNFCRVEGIDIGEILTTHFIRLKSAYTSYSGNHSKQLSTLRECVKHCGPKAAKWLAECAYLAKSRSDCWDLESLLIKPIQRITKYPLLIDALLNGSRDELTFEQVEKLYDAKTLLEKTLELINQGSARFSADHQDQMVPIESSEEKIEFARQLKAFKDHHKTLQYLKKEVRLSLEPLLNHIMFQKKFAQSWKSFMDYDEQEQDENYIQSIYSSFLERITQHEQKTKLLIVETEGKIIRAIDLTLEYCTGVQEKIHDFQSNKGAYLNYIKNGEHSHNHYVKNSSSAAQKYITIQNELKDDLPVMLSTLAKFEHLIVLQYHQQIQKWFKEMVGRKSLEEHQKYLASGEKTLGDNFDIVELYSQSKHDTREALKDLCIRSPYRPALNDYESSDLKISASRVVRRLFGV